MDIELENLKYTGNEKPKISMRVTDLKGNDISHLFETFIDDDGCANYKYTGEETIECIIHSIYRV